MSGPKQYIFRILCHGKLGRDSIYDMYVEGRSYLGHFFTISFTIYFKFLDFHGLEWSNYFGCFTYMSGSNQGDQIGRIFAQCVIVSFGQFDENYRNRSQFRLPTFAANTYIGLCIR
jgi:hypothetical protein